MIYADHNATSPLDPEVWAAMRPFFETHFHNPSSPYTPARTASLALTRAREQVAALVEAESARVYFTSGGTEANAMAIATARAWRPERRHWVCSAVEHAAILEPLRALEQEGHRITRIPVDREGRLDLDALRAALTDDTALVSVMSANNETGALHPIAEVAALARARGIPVHADAAQSVGRVPVSLRAWGIDLLSCCAHKMHGPKGAGALIVGVERKPAAFLRGGGQEQGLRAGTENVPALAGFGVAAALAQRRLAEDAAHTRALRDRVEGGVCAALPDVRVAARETERLPNTTMFLVPGVDTDVLLARLDMDGACCSSGSACASGSAEPSHVLRAMGWGAAPRPAALRVSWGRFNTLEDSIRLEALIINGVQELRARSRDSRTSPRT